MSNGKKISIHFHPFGIEKNQHIVEKVEGGVKRKYLRGVSSGIKVDGHGERMTENCIKSMMEQGNSGNVLLYAGLHGVNFVDDIGILSNSDIYNKTEWVTDYRLYDELDQLEDPLTLGKVSKLWKQVNGIRPYKKKIQKGFSVEGIVPESAILDKKVDEHGNYSNRVIDNMVLDGVVVVNRPAYTDSVATAVYKCLGELPPAGIEKVRTVYKSDLSKHIQDEEKKRNFYQKYFELNSALEEKIFEIMRNEDPRNQQRLEILLDEYKNLVIGIVLQNGDTFREEVAIVSDGIHDVGKSDELLTLIKSINDNSKILTSGYLRRLGGKGE